MIETRINQLVNGVSVYTGHFEQLPADVASKVVLVLRAALQMRKELAVYCVANGHQKTGGAQAFDDALEVE